ncbi:MAG: hypothetical protein MJ041_03575 [Acidaminococcaceae bacterium]|nr:hypothetical protein [Acidaminococcaceae bacterium]
MTGIETADPSLVVNRILIIMVGAFLYIYAISFAIGQERREKWFHKRKHYTFFNKRGFLGEYLNYGYPCTVPGFLVAILMYGVIFGVGYWYLFKLPY